MQSLPEELQEEILLSLKEPEDFYKACAASKQNRAICSESSFWREKFRRENLPLVEEGNNFSTWRKIYRKSIRAAEMTDRKILSGESIKVSLISVEDVNILLPLGNTKEIAHYWKIMKTFTNKEEKQGYTIVHKYNLVFSPSPKVSTYDLVDNYVKVTPEKLPINGSIELFTDTVSTEDFWFVLYQTTYWNLLDFSNEQLTSLGSLKY